MSHFSGHFEGASTFLKLYPPLSVSKVPSPTNYRIGPVYQRQARDPSSHQECFWPSADQYANTLSI
jgi:hypothetical protein